MSLKSNAPASEKPIPLNTGCLDTRDVPGVCLRIESARQRLALPYALLLLVEISEDQALCEIAFATHKVTVRGRDLRAVYVAVSQGLAVQVSVRDPTAFVEGQVYYGPTVTGIQIEPLEESGRARR
jgi:hypothetical protein